MDADELDWNRTLREQWESHWNHQLRARLEGLTDDEYFWSPVPDAWSVRPRGSSTAPVQVGAGDFTMDYAFPEPVPHLSEVCLLRDLYLHTLDLHTTPDTSGATR